jgi:hypothetical protein
MSNLIRAPFPPACGCGQNPCVCEPEWGKWAFRLRECFNEVEQFKQLVADVIRQLGGPIERGITDGSNARQGEVGEYVTGSATFNYAAAPATSTGVVVPLVLQPGDWDISGFILFSTLVGGSSAMLTPMPAGFSNDMLGTIDLGATPSTAGLLSVLQLSTVRANVTVPTPLALTLTVFQDVAGYTAGFATVTTEARRMR